MRSNTRGSRVVTAVAASAVLGMTALLVTGCNDDDVKGKAVSSSVSAPSSVAGAPASGSPTAGQPVRTIGKTGWFEGFDITVTKATVTDQLGGARLVIDVSYKNTGTENKTVDNGFLQVGDRTDSGAIFDSPTVPGKGTATGTVTTSLKSGANVDQVLDSITVVYGQSSDNQTKIPLAAAGKVDSVQPRVLPISGKLTQGQITIEVTDGKLSPSYVRGERGKYELALHVKIVGGPGVPAGGMNVFENFFSVQTPDGQSLVADNRSPVNELPEKNQTIDKPGNYVVFVVPAPGTGNYVLSYDGKTGDDAPPATFAFSV